MQGLELYEKVREVPAEAKKTIKGGRISGMTDINPMWRIKVLTEQFGPCGIGWYYIPTRKWMETSGSETAAFVDIDLYVKIDGEWSKPIPGTGGSMFATKERNGVYVSDECYKMATTDAISVACKQLGIGADVYWDADRTKYDRQDKQDSSPTQRNPEEKGNVRDKQAAAEKIRKEQINRLYNECGRTGVEWRKVCERYNVKSFSEMTISQYNHAMGRLQATPDKLQKEEKKLDPSTIPPGEPDDKLPWNTPQR